MRKIIFTRADGNCSITSPVRNIGDEKLTDLQIETRAMNKLPEGALNAKFIKEADIPKDRIFRDAWQDTGGKPVENLVKCKVLAHDARRAKRDKDMKPHDDIIAKQIPGEDATRAEADRATIRTADAAKQKRIDKANTVSALKGEM